MSGNGYGLSAEQRKYVEETLNETEDVLRETGILDSGQQYGSVGEQEGLLVQDDGQESILKQVAETPASAYALRDWAIRHL